MDNINSLKELILSSDNIVFFGGAGVSTESGIPDFRSADGIYNTKYKYPPETILSHDFFMKNTEEFYRFYREKMIFKDAQPNMSHRALAYLEKKGRVKNIITQNIDGLHTSAGSVYITELHGSIHRNFCMKCKDYYGLEYILKTTGIPKCSCGGIIKPDVVLYGEQLKKNDISSAVNTLRNADMVIVGGTSLDVYPAAGFLDYYKGEKLVVINKTPIKVNDRACLVIEEKIGEVLGRAVEII